MKDVLLLGDCLEIMKGMKDKSVSLVFGSPPYNKRRTYGIDFDLEGQDWVDWMVKVFEASLRISKGLVAFVVGHGDTKKFRWDGTPALLCADLIRKGICLRDPKWYYRFGIPGSGGTDDLRKDIEWIICATNGGKLPWSDNKAMGRKPKYKPGGVVSHRLPDGTRINVTMKKGTSGIKDGDLEYKRQRRIITDITNPGSVIACGAAGGGRLGSKLAHENEAPFDVKLPNLFIRTFCPPDGIVLDPFAGSGTTLASAVKAGRHYIGIDIRESQIKLSARRIKEAQFNKGFGLM